MIIISNKPGQLGNRLIIFSHWISYSLDKNETILNPAFDDYAAYFKGTYNQRISKFPNKSTSNQPIGKLNFIFQTCYYIARILHRFNIKAKFLSYIYLDWNQQKNLDELPTNKNRILFVQGWLFRSENRNKSHKKAITEYFDIVEPHRSNVNNFINPLREKYGKIVGVHIRHGDYKTFEGGKYFYTFEEYKTHIADLYRQLKDQNPVFVICSNVKINLSDFDGLPIVTGPGHFIEDMYVFSKCDYLVGPPSTFTRWASYYGGVPLSFIKKNETINLKNL